MPLQNRVTPFGDIVAVADRGLFTGNRGILHDPETRTIKRAWTSKRWLVCLCEFKGRKRSLMAPGRWTELFFLDEATAPTSAWLLTPPSTERALAAGYGPRLHPSAFAVT